MLAVNQISKSFNLAQILSEVTFSVGAGERAGLVGPNGCGKSTLLRIILGQEKADSGSVRLTPADLVPGYLPQGFQFSENETVRSYLNASTGDPDTLDVLLEKVSCRLASDPADESLAAEYDRLLERITHAAEDEGRAQQTLAALGLDGIPPDFPAQSLSGGQKTRLALAGVLLARPKLLLLDEPTNHLDIAMLEWLEAWLGSYRGAAMVVSHDRAFLDATVTRILEIDERNHRLKAYEGNYSDFVAQKESEREKQWSQYRDQQAEIRRMQQDILREKESAAYNERQASSIRIGGPEMKLKGMKDHVQGIAKKVAKKAKARETKLERYLESADRVEKPRQNWEMKIEFQDTGETGRDVLVLEHLSAGYGDLVLLEDVTLRLRFGGRVALIGPNGSGKTTLLKIIRGELDPLSGRARLGARVKIGTMSQEHGELEGVGSALDLIQGETGWNDTEARAFLSRYLFKGDEVFTPTERLSHGERARLILARLVAAGCNFLMLDEPINHLDIPARVQFEQALREFKGTVLAVVHDRYFIENFASEIWEVTERTIRTREVYCERVWTKGWHLSR
jgi:ATP-binding cassette subfamily F protein 3